MRRLVSELGRDLIRLTSQSSPTSLIHTTSHLCKCKAATMIAGRRFFLSIWEKNACCLVRLFVLGFLLIVGAVAFCPLQFGVTSRLSFQPITRHF